MNGYSIIGGSKSGTRSPIDIYPTPPDVTYALLDFLKLPRHTRIWEPAAGDGHMVKAIESRGYYVIGTDILTGTDFLTADVPAEVDMIITNPPFKWSEDFIWRAAKTGIPFAFLLKSQYWHASRRRNLFESLPPSYVLPLTWRPQFDPSGSKKSPVMDVVWNVWLLGIGGPIYWPLTRPG